MKNNHNYKKSGQDRQDRRSASYERSDFRRGSFEGQDKRRSSYEDRERRYGQNGGERKPSYRRDEPYENRAARRSAPKGRDNERGFSGKTYPGKPAFRQDRPPRRYDDVPRKPKPTQPREEEAVASVRLDAGALEQRSEEGLYTLEGKNAIWEALKAGRALDRLLIAQGMDESGIGPILAVAHRGQTKIERVPKAVLDKYSLRGKHQGMIAFLPAMEYADFNETIDAALIENPAPVVMILDEVQDPHNLGAIIRSAYCSGAACVVVPQHRSCGLTATVAKASAGAIHHLPVCKVTNLAHAIEELQEKGFRVFGADMDGQNCFTADFTGSPVALVIGNEGEGLRRLVKESCDETVSIPLIGDLDSLNASVAAGILLYEVLRQRSFAHE